MFSALVFFKLYYTKQINDQVTGINILIFHLKCA